jgi:glycosyltransferase involved in cell wall biosynthesis
VRVLHVHRIRAISGSERHLLTLLPALRERGVDARFLGLDDPPGRPGAFYEELRAAGVPFERVRAPRDLSPALAWRVAARVRAARPDIVHTHLVHADVYGALGAAASRCALVSSKHNDDPFRTGAFRLAERVLTRRASRVIAITEALARFNVERVGLPAAKVVVVRYGLDDAPAARGVAVDAPPSARVLLAVGRLVPQKGHDLAVRALAEVRPTHADAVLVVLGEGPERGRLQALARDLGIADAVLLPGNVDGVGDWLARADVVVHPARWEGFGLVLLEAMLAERPVVAAGVSSIPELVRDGETGLVVPPEDPSALALAVLRLLGDERLRARLAAGALAHARAELSVGRMAEGTIAVYEDVLAARPAATAMRSAHDSTE